MLMCSCVSSGKLHREDIQFPAQNWVSCMSLLLCEKALSEQIKIVNVVILVKKQQQQITEFKAGEVGMSHS